MTKTKVVSVRMSEAMHARLSRLAAADRRPLSQFIEIVLEDYLRAKGEWNDEAEGK